MGENKLPRRANYRSYLLRPWRDGSTADWRASLEDTTTGQRQAFANVKLLVNFLDHQLNPVASPEADHSQRINPREPEAQHESENQR